MAHTAASLRFLGQSMLSRTIGRGHRVAARLSISSAAMTHESDPHETFTAMEDKVIFGQRFSRQELHTVWRGWEGRGGGERTARLVLKLCECVRARVYIWV